jgi:hypothetical protein
MKGGVSAANEVEEQLGCVSAAEKDMGISQGPAAEWGRSPQAPIYDRVSQGIPGYPPGFWAEKDIRTRWRVSASG